MHTKVIGMLVNSGDELVGATRLLRRASTYMEGIPLQFGGE